jgi:hypothetical protein
MGTSQSTNTGPRRAEEFGVIKVSTALQFYATLIAFVLSLVCFVLLFGSAF